MSKDIKKWSYETEIKYLDSENKNLKNERDKLEKEIVHLKECNLRYRNHNELLESIIGIRINVTE